MLRRSILSMILLVVMSGGQIKAMSIAKIAASSAGAGVAVGSALYAYDVKPSYAVVAASATTFAMNLALIRYSFNSRIKQLNRFAEAINATSRNSLIIVQPSEMLEVVARKGYPKNPLSCAYRDLETVNNQMTGIYDTLREHEIFFKRVEGDHESPDSVVNLIGRLKDDSRKLSSNAYMKQEVLDGLISKMWIDWYWHLKNAKKN